MKTFKNFNSIHLFPLFILLLSTSINCYSQSFTLDFEAPDANFNGSKYEEGGISYQHDNTWNYQNTGAWGLTSGGFDGGQCLYVESPSYNVTSDREGGNRLVHRREWHFDRTRESDGDIWYSYYFRLDNNYENPRFHPNIINQVRNNGSYWGFNGSLELGTVNSATANVPLIWRKMVGGGDQSEVNDSGHRSTGITLERNRWYFIMVNYRHHISDGYYRVWVDGQQVVNSNGFYRQPNRNDTRIRLGLYGDTESRYHKVYFDHYRRGSTRAEVELDPTSIVIAPKFSPRGGNYIGDATVSIATLTPGASIRYTLNGDNPAPSSPPYTGPLTLSNAGMTTIKSRAFKNGNSSDVVEASYNLVAPDVCQEVNTALLKNITAFSNEQASNGAFANNVNDGSLESKWSAEGFPQHVTIDLGGHYDVDKIELVPYQERAYQFFVEVSDDNNTYTTATDQQSNTNGGLLISKEFSMRNARYVKLTVTGASAYTGNWVSLHEFRVFNSCNTINTHSLTVVNGTGDGDYSEGSVVNISADEALDGQTFDTWSGDIENIADVMSNQTTITMPGSDITVTATYKDLPTGIENVALGKSVTFSTFQSPNDKLVDGITSDDSRWSADGFPQNAVIDLGADYDLSSFEVYPFQDRAYRYSLSASTDGTNYVDVVDQSSNNIPSDVFTHNVSATARYIRITVTGAGGGYGGSWVSLNELMVFGSLNEVDPVCNLNVSTAELNFTSVSSNQDFSFTATDCSGNVDISDDQSWISTSTDGNTVTVSVDENTSTSSRTGSISVLIDEESEEISVTQGGATPVCALSTSTSLLNFGSSASDNNFTFTATNCAGNVDVSNDQNWISTSATGNTVTVNVTENTNTSSRSGIVTVSFDGQSKVVGIEQAGATSIATNVALNKSVTFSTFQSPNDNLVDGDTSDDSRWSAEGFPQNAVIDLGADYDLTSLEVYPFQNRAYQYTVATSTNGINYTDVVDQSNSNTSSDVFIHNVAVTVRYIRINVTGAGGGYGGSWVSLAELMAFGTLNEAIPICDLSVSASELNFTSASGNQDISFTTSDCSGNVGVSDDQNWITTSVNGNTVSVSVLENTGTSSRTGTVTISIDNESEEVNITQEAGSVFVPDENSLRFLADQANLKIGAATRNDFWNLSDASTYENVLKNEYNTIVCENHMKPRFIQPSQGVFDFGPADQHVSFTKENGMVVRGHTLLWHQGNPDWLENGNFTRSELIEIMEEHITTTIQHFGTDVPVWDVVNEAWVDSGYRSSFWYNTIGPEYIEMAFQFAKAANPNIKLFYNDYNTERFHRANGDRISKVDHIYDMCVDFINRGIPIDGVGFQFHISSTFPLTETEAVIQQFADLGLEIHITELDVKIRQPTAASDLEDQADVYEKVFDIALNQPACTYVVMWGFTDKYSWIDNFSNGEFSDPLLFHENYNKKPAYFSVQNRLQQGRSGEVNCFLGTNKSLISFTSTSGSQDFTYTHSNCFGEVIISDEQEWITTTANGNTVTVSVTENTSASNRAGSVTISIDGESEVINIDQSGTVVVNCDGNNNVALSGTATASTEESGSLSASNAIDGSVDTRWASVFADPQWIRIDLGESYNISRVQLRWEAAFGSAYEIQVSDDATTWTTIFTESSGSGGTDNITELNGTGRYV